MPMNGFGVCGMPHMPYGMPGPPQPEANQGGSPTFGGQSPCGSRQASQQQAGPTGPPQSGPAPSTSTTIHHLPNQMWVQPASLPRT